MARTQQRFSQEDGALPEQDSAQSHAGLGFCSVSRCCGAHRAGWEGVSMHHGEVGAWHCRARRGGAGHIHNALLVRCNPDHGKAWEIWGSPVFHTTALCVNTLPVPNSHAGWHKAELSAQARTHCSAVVTLCSYGPGNPRDNEQPLPLNSPPSSTGKLCWRRRMGVSSGPRSGRTTVQ